MTKFSGRHAGERCFVVGSGPSIARMDLSWLKDEITICVNQSYKALDFDPTYVCIGDRELWPRIKHVYARMRSTIICSTGTKGTVGTDYAGKNLGLVVPLDMARRVPQGHFRHDLKSVCVAYNVVPEIVLPFVLHAGFFECFLVGCDCTDEGYFYPEDESARPDWPQRVMPETMDAYPVIRRYTDDRGLTRIINATYGGRLEAFPRVLFDSLRPGAPPAPLVIGYHTPHPKYRDLAAGMARSARDFGLEVVIRELPHVGRDELASHMNWVLNCAQCPQFIAAMQREFPARDLIYLDADAVMHKRPALYLDGTRDYDFAAAYLTNAHVTHELQSNSLYFAASEKSRQLARAWLDEQEKRNARMLAGEFKHPFHEAWDQKVLQDVVGTIDGLRHIELPLTYAKIMPTPRGYEITPDVPLDEAVITQHQASREMRHRQNEPLAAGPVVDNPPAAGPWVFSPRTEPWALKHVTGRTRPVAEAFELLSRAEYEAYGGPIRSPRRVLDLACGLGRVSVFLNRMLADPGIEYVLADSTTPADVKPRYGWNAPEFYNDLAATDEFCRANGVANFRTFNVRADGWWTLRGWPDLIISMLGVGFHVPLETEMDRLHAISHSATTLIFGVAGVADFPDWERENNFESWFEKQFVIPFESEHPTHEGRVLILKGKR